MTISAQTNKELNCSSETESRLFDQRIDTAYGVNVSDKLLPFLKRNFFFFLLSAVIFGLGWGTAMVPTNPLLAKKLNVSNTFFGIIGTLSGVFSILGPIIAPAISRRFIRKKWLFFLLQEVYLVSPALIGISVLFCSKYNCVHLLPTLILFFLIQWTSVPYLFQIPKAEFIAQTISKSYLGRYYGFEGSIAPLTSLVGTFFAGYFLRGTQSADPSFNQYAFCLLLGFGVAQVGAIIVLFAREVPDTIPCSSVTSVPFQTLILKCWNDIYYRPFLLFVFALCVLRAPFGFVPIYGFKSLNMPSAAQAIIAITIAVSQFVSAPPSGYLCDRLGAGKTLAIGLGLQFLTIIPLCFFRNQFGVYAYLAIDAASMIVTQVACMAFVLRYASAESRCTYVAAYWMIQALAAIIVTAPFALLLDTWSYTTVFWIWSGLHIVVLVLVLGAIRRGVVRHMFEKAEIT